jgi:hypothetical protein
MTARWTVAALALTSAVLAGCGDSKSSNAGDDPTPTRTPTTAVVDTPTGSPTPDGTPQCDEVWKADGKLPGAYKLCYEGPTAVKSSTDYCEFGKRIFTYDDHFYAVRSGTIHHTKSALDQDKGYVKALAACMG